MTGSRSDTSCGKKDSRRRKASPRGHRKAIARSLGVSLAELAPTRGKKGDKKKGGRFILELAASAAALVRPEVELLQ